MHFLVKIVLCILTFTTAAAIGEPRTCSIEWSSIGWSTFKKIKCSNITFLSTLENDNCYHYVELSINNSSIISLNENTIPRKKTCDLSHLKLTHTQIETITDDAFIKFPKIIKLTLDFNNITNLEFLGYLVELAVLNMQYNKLTQIKAKDFRHLRKLEIINIAHNNVTTVGNLSYNLESLKELYLNNNNIVEIGDVFGKLQLLTILNLSHNKIKLIKEGTFSGLNNLNLNLSGCDISFIEPNSFQIDRFESLDLSNNKLGSFENNCLRTRFIGDFLLQNNPINLSSNSTILNTIDGIYSLDLSACSENVTILQADFLMVNNLNGLKLTATCIGSIHPQAFTHCISLLILDLSNNKIQTINSFTFFPLVNLQTLDLSKNPIIELFEHAFSNLKSLRSFNISGINWVVEAYHFDGLNNLKYLQFVDSRDIQLKSKCFSRLSNLQSLKFTNTTINSIDTEAFSGMRILPESNLCQNRGENGYALNLCDLSLRSFAAGAFNGMHTPIRVINLNNNNIEVIETNAFNGMTNLKQILLVRANISFIDSFAFSNLSFNKINYYESYNNTGIYINLNKIDKISSNSFSNISALNTLNLAISHIKHIEAFSFNNLSFCDCKVCSNSISLQHNEISTILNQTFTEIFNVKEIDLSYNKINHLDSNIFNSIQFCIDDDTGYRYPSTIYLNSNFLTTIDPETFLPLTYLTGLDLSYNNFTVIEEYVFIGLHSLSWLSLKNNNLFKLSPDSFAGLNSLNQLFLSENFIQDFPVGTFQNFPTLKNLELGYNQLTKLKSGSFSNLGNLDSLILCHNNFVALDETTFYPLHNLTLLNLDDNLLYSISYTSLLDHLRKLRYISVNDNNWNCRLLLKMLKSFKDRNVVYSYNATRRFAEENIDGVSCNGSEENVEEYTTISSKHSNKLDFVVNLFPPGKITKFSNQQLNSTNNDQYLTPSLFSQLFNNSNKLLSAVYELLNATKLIIKEPKQSKIENDQAQIIKENTSETLKLLLKLTNSSNNLPVTSKSIYSKEGHRTNDVQNLNSTNNNFSSYILLLILFAMLCLMSVNTYKRYFYKKKFSQNENPCSEMILLDAN